MGKYSFINLCSWTKDAEIVCPMSPAMLIKPIREVMKGKFGGLARVRFSGIFDAAYQECEDPTRNYPTTGYDTLIYKAIYKNAVSLVFFVDRGTNLNVIAEMTKFTGEDSRVKMIDEESETRYFQTLSQDELFIMFERANAVIKINQENETRQPAVAISQ